MKEFIYLFFFFFWFRKDFYFIFERYIRKDIGSYIPVNRSKYAADGQIGLYELGLVL